MQGKTECAPVHRQQCTAAEQPVRFQRIGRTEMDVSPCRVICANLEHHQIERAETLADRFIFGGQTGITAKEHAMPIALYYE